MDNSRCRNGEKANSFWVVSVMDRDGKKRRNVALKNDGAVNFISKPIKVRETGDEWCAENHESIFVHGINCDSWSCCTFGRRENLHSCQLAEADEKPRVGSFRFDTCDLFNSSLLRFVGFVWLCFWPGLKSNYHLVRTTREWWVGVWLA